jgi:hypothetical protein
VLSPVLLLLLAWWMVRASVDLFGSRMTCSLTCSLTWIKCPIQSDHDTFWKMWMIGWLVQELNSFVYNWKAGQIRISSYTSASEKSSNRASRPNSNPPQSTSSAALTIAIPYRHCWTRKLTLILPLLYAVFVMPVAPNYEAI